MKYRDCMSRWWGAGVHNFQPRYDEQRTTPEWIASAVQERTKIKWVGDQDWKKTYVHDICSRCGDVVQRPSVK